MVRIKAMFLQLRSHGVLKVKIKTLLFLQVPAAHLPRGQGIWRAKPQKLSNIDAEWKVLKLF